MQKIVRVSLILFGLLATTASDANAQSSALSAAPRTVATTYGFDALLTRLETSIAANNNMSLVAQASASRGVAGRGVKIPGNAVLMVFRNDYAVRVLAASVRPIFGLAR